jgi:hypothetical protein
MVMAQAVVTVPAPTTAPPSWARRRRVFSWRGSLEERSSWKMVRWGGVLGSVEKEVEEVAVDRVFLTCSPMSWKLLVEAFEV